MSKLLTLMAVQYKQRYGFASLRYQWRTRRGKFVGSLALGLLVLVTVGSLYGFYAWGSVRIIHTTRGLQRDLAEDLMALLMLLASIMILFSGTRSILSRLFLGRDTEFLAMLPVQEGIVFLSKFLSVALGQIAFSALLILPPALAYPDTLSAAWFLRTLLVIVFLPSIPLVISALLSLLLMRFSAMKRFKDLFAVVGGLLITFLAILAQQLLIAQMPENIDVGFLLQYLLGRQSLITNITAWYPPARWATQAVTGVSAEAWLSLLPFILSSLVSLVLVYLLSSRTYYRGALSQQQAQRKRKKAGAKEAVYPVHRPWVAVMIKEWRMLMRTPAYALNALSGVMIIPILALIPILQPEARAELNAFLDLVLRQVDDRLLLLILTGILCLFASLNPAVSTVFSREGRDFWLCKVLPVPPRQQVWGKLVFGLILMLAFEVLFFVAMLLFIPSKMGLLLMAAVLAALMSWGSLVASVYVDLRSPRLSWENPTRAIKQNMHTLMGWAFAILIMALVGGCGGLLISAGVALTWGTLALLALAVLIAAGSTWILLKSADRLYLRIEV